MTESVRLDDLISHVLEQHPDGDALQHLTDAVEVSGHLGELADHLIGHFVDQARRSGASWTDIGQYMGVTKQAVQKRFVPRESEDIDFPTGGRLSRFTMRARGVLRWAKDEAERRGDKEVRNEHVMLGVVNESEGLAALAIVALGVELDQVRDAMRAALGTPVRRQRAAHFSREAKKTMELALREALRLGHNYIGTEHLLLGMLRNEDERAARILTELGVEHDRAEEWLVETLAGIAAAKQ
jgi:hypothetical protein